MYQNRRTFIKQSGLMMAGISFYGLSACGDGVSNSSNNGNATAIDSTATAAQSKELFFKISLAQWSLHKAIFDGQLDPLDFPAYTKNTFGINAVEYVNQFYKDNIGEEGYLQEWKKRADDAGVHSLLIMVDGEGNLGNLDADARRQAVDNHKKWLEAAQYLGCHSIRVNAAGEGSPEEVAAAAAEGLAALGDLAAPMNLNVIVENHGGYSSNGQWLAGVIQNAGKDNVGTLPDFGNFCIEKDDDGNCINEYDRYKGVEELMPFAKAVSAKTNDFDEAGNEKNTDFTKMMKIVKEHGYTGYVGIEYEGSDLSEEAGIMATKELLIRTGQSME